MQKDVVALRLHNAVFVRVYGDVASAGALTRFDKLEFPLVAVGGRGIKRGL